MKLEGYDWEEAFAVSGVSTVPGSTITVATAGVALADVEEVFGCEVGENDGDNWVACGRLKSGLYFFIEAGCDYTGWDCQASGTVYLSDTKENLFNLGIDADSKRRMSV